jgi:hypothetical protein
MNFELIAFGIVLIAVAYGLCILIVMAVTFGAAHLLGKQLATDGQPHWTWNVLNIATWVVASLIAGVIVQAPVGDNTLMTTAVLAAVLFVVHLRATFVMKLQQSAAAQLLLCILCPLSVFAAWEYLSN